MVVAYDEEGGIGKDGKLPWHVAEDMRFFKEVTSGGTVVMGRKTWESIPAKFRPLPGRRNIVLSSTLTAPKGGDFEVSPSLLHALSLAAKERECVADVSSDAEVSKHGDSQEEERNCFLIGGVDSINESLERFSHLCDGIYATELKGTFDTDARISLSWQSRCTREDIAVTLEPEGHSYCRRLYRFTGAAAVAPEQPYLDLLTRVMAEGEERRDRTGVGTRSLFGERMVFDISRTLPVITTKKVLVSKVIGELLWLISGSTAVADLQKRGIHFWDANSSRDFLDKRGLAHYKEGDLGPVYGFQWRHFGAEYDGCDAEYNGKGEDQLQEVVRLLREDPFSRRILLSAWNPSDLKKMALPPCHLLAQFYVREEKYLDCQLYQRSGDLFLGVPFNITSYATLTYMLAHVTGLLPGRFTHVLGDAHIYLNHTDAVEQQLSRTPRPFPRLLIKERDDGTTIAEIDDFNADDFQVIGYSPCAFIRAPMAV